MKSLSFICALFIASGSAIASGDDVKTPSLKSKEPVKTAFKQGKFSKMQERIKAEQKQSPAHYPEGHEKVTPRD
jgi:hypothetical protein